MASTKRRYSKEEFARRGDARVATKFARFSQRLMRTIADRVRKSLPDPQIWLVHVTLGYLRRFGAHAVRGQPWRLGSSRGANL